MLFIPYRYNVQNKGLKQNQLFTIHLLDIIFLLNKFQAKQHTTLQGQQKKKSKCAKEVNEKTLIHNKGWDLEIHF